MSFFSYYNKSVTGVEPAVSNEPLTLEALQLPAAPLKGSHSDPVRPVDSRGDDFGGQKSGAQHEQHSQRDWGQTWDPLKAYLREACVYPLLKRHEEDELARLVQEGDLEARERMILSNLRLVIKVAKEYDQLGLPLVDLINMGNIGLMTAVERFEPERGAKFSTYAVWWIRQGIFRGLSNQARTVRLPTHKIQQINHLKRVKEQLDMALGREALDTELAVEAEVPVGSVRALLSMSRNAISLDAPLGSDTDDTVGSTLAEDPSKTPNALSERLDLHRHVRGYLEKLHPRERLILTRRFGLDGKNPETLEQIGADYHVTRERIRQIEAKALLKLKRMTLGREVEEGA